MLKIIEGLGLCAISRVTFNPGESIFTLSGQVINKPTLGSLKLSEHLHLHDSYFLGYVSHSCNPNCTANIKTLIIECIEPIKLGDKITMDYMQTETALYRSFQCVCRNDHCRGKIG